MLNPVETNSPQGELPPNLHSNPFDNLDTLLDVDQTQSVDLVQAQLEDESIQFVLELLSSGREVSKEEERSLEPNTRHLTRLYKQGDLYTITTNQGNTFLVKRASLQPRIVVGSKARKDVIELAHAAGHPGITRTEGNIKLKFYWTGMRDDVVKYVNQCIVCVEKKSPDVHVGRHMDRSTNNTWDRIYVDLIGPFTPISGAGNRYALTILDSYSKFLVVCSIPDKRAKTVVHALMFNALLKYGVPQVIYSDQGSEFKNTLITEVGKRLGFNNKYAISLDHRANAVERTHRDLNGLFRILHSTEVSSETLWDQTLQVASFIHISHVSSATG